MGEMIEFRAPPKRPRCPPADPVAAACCAAVINIAVATIMVRAMYELLLGDLVDTEGRRPCDTE